MEREIYEFESKCMTDFKLYNLPEETTIITSEAKEYSSRYPVFEKYMEQCHYQNFSECTKSHIQTPVIKDACNLLIKQELEINDYKIENFKVKVVKNEYGYECVKQEDKNEVIDHQRNLNLDDRIAIKKFNEDVLTQKEVVVKVETNNDEEMHRMALKDWKIKNEELEIKEELKESGGSISPDCFVQDSQSNSKNYPREGNDQYPYQTPVNNNLRQKSQPDNTKEIQKFKCDQCSYKTILESRLNEHLLLHRNLDNADMFKCNKCNFQDVRKQVLKRHLFRHHKSQEIQTFQCSQCLYKTIERSHLKAHVLLHKRPDEVNMFKCDKCTVQTIHKRSLMRHQLLHYNPKEVQGFTCYKCNFQTVHKRSLKRHQLLHNNPGEGEVFTCYKCYFQTIHKKSFKRHLLRHNNSEEMQFSGIQI